MRERRDERKEVVLATPFGWLREGTRVGCEKLGHTLKGGEEKYLTVIGLLRATRGPCGRLHEGLREGVGVE